jgi:hypothetical protein
MKHLKLYVSDSAMPKKTISKKRTQPRFGRAILPAEHFHTTKKGARGYRRDEEKKKAKQALENKDEG